MKIQFPVYNKIRPWVKKIRVWFLKNLNSVMTQPIQSESILGPLIPCKTLVFNKQARCQMIVGLSMR